MSRRVNNKNQIRNLQKTRGSYYISIPIDIIRKFGWQERQKVVVKEAGKEKIVITDWKK